MKNINELIERLELANGCLIGSHISGNTARQQFETIIKELKQVENLSLCAVSHRRELLETVIGELDMQVGTNYSTDKNLINTIESSL